MIDVDLRLVAQHYAHRCDWIMGAQDPLLPVTLHHQLPGQVQVLQTGHCPMLSQPERLWGTLGSYGMIPAIKQHFNIAAPTYTQYALWQHEQAQTLWIIALVHDVIH
jgi:hypothetical protein